MATSCDGVGTSTTEEVTGVPPGRICAVTVVLPFGLNVNGGAVALGHPIGASGARVLVTLLYELQRRNLKRGIAALCLGGGNAVAVAVERQ